VERLTPPFFVISVFRQQTRIVFFCVEVTISNSHKSFPMDKSTRFVVVAKTTFKTINQGSWTQRDNESKGKLEFEVFRLSAQGLVRNFIFNFKQNPSCLFRVHFFRELILEIQTSISKLSLDVFPGVPAESAQSITIPDYLVAGNEQKNLFQNITE
jgi:hypothetical protein